MFVSYVIGMFGVLPPEIEVIIIEMLPNKDLASMEMTSSHFKDVVGGGEFWKKRAEIEARLMINMINIYVSEVKAMLEEADGLLQKLLVVDEILGPLPRIQDKIQEGIEIKMKMVIKLDKYEDLKKKTEEALGNKMWKKVLNILI